MQNMKCNQAQMRSSAACACHLHRSQMGEGHVGCAAASKDGRSSCVEPRNGGCYAKEWEEKRDDCRARSECPARTSCSDVQPRQTAACLSTESDCLSGMASLGMVYGPCQAFSNLYGPDEALESGTIFCDLNMPFRPGYGCVNPGARRGCGR